ncbi:hypothetical protein [Micromonospora sp. NBS 11-29]|uniref:hypothetical protein n=1 Tax=Micromonospora sp. NBS 11-29 TaxID=1960879 RepID=UPI000B77C8A1|nr:hypothetical protein [Micromonospora sp. NBS 11-29]
MDRHQVRAALLAAGLSPDAFALEGVHEQVPVPPDFWFLRRAPGGGWEIGLYERGGYDVRQRFGTEEEACAGLWQALTGRPAPP